MDNDLMDSWLNCVYGVDCETHRQALSEIQRLRDERDAIEGRLWKLEDEVTAHVELRETIKGLVHNLEKAA